MSNRALITGITGQDGPYLAKFLLDKGYDIYGVYRRSSTPNFWRLQHLGIFEEVNLVSANLIDSSGLREAIELSEPDEIYNLAAQSFVGSSFEQPLGTTMASGLGVTRLLESIRALDLEEDVKFYQASTSELFGNVSEVPQRETTRFEPASPYAAAKLYGYWITNIYRESYNLFACNGILFNHESPLRGLEFVTRKITNAVAKIELGLVDELRLGNLKSKRDWGYAPDYVRSMWLMLQQPDPEDYVVATNETYTVETFARLAFEHVGRDYRDYVEVDEKYVRPLEVQELRGDYSKARAKLGWEPETTLQELIETMVETDLSRWERWLDGERFPWDAPNHPEDNQIISRKYSLDR
jgi:GDPmannose 4,6-dehydratase